jgi:hypothetical protein
MRSLRRLIVALVLAGMLSTVLIAPALATSDEPEGGGMPTMECNEGGFYQDAGPH